MSFAFASERLANVREDAQLLLEGVRDHENQLEALVVAGEGDVGHAEAAVSRAADPNAVLVADDYGDVRELLACVLEDAGFVVRTAANGLEAFLAAYEMRPAVIVMDLSMPVLDGIDATRLIKAVGVTRDARVIAYTGNPCFDANPTRTLFAAVLLKPATPDVVLAAVRHVAAL
jgi:two-component system, cell cycle response regulator DivK